MAHREGGGASLRGAKCPALTHHRRRSGHSGQQTKAVREGKVIARRPATRGAAKRGRGPHDGEAAPGGSPRSGHKPTLCAARQRVPHRLPSHAYKHPLVPGPSTLRTPGNTSSGGETCSQPPASGSAAILAPAVRTALPRPPTAALPLPAPTVLPWEPGPALPPALGAGPPLAARPAQVPLPAEAPSHVPKAAAVLHARFPRRPPWPRHSHGRSQASWAARRWLPPQEPARAAQHRLPASAFAAPSFRGKQRAGLRTQARLGHPFPPGRQGPGAPSPQHRPPPLPSSEPTQLLAGERERDHGGPLLTCVRPSRPSHRAAPARGCATPHREVRAAAQGRGLQARQGLGRRSSRWPPAPRGHAQWAHSPDRTIGPRTREGEPEWALRRSAPPPLPNSSRPPPSCCRSAEPPPPSVGWKPRA